MRIHPEFREGFKEGGMKYKKGGDFQYLFLYFILITAYYEFCWSRDLFGAGGLLHCLERFEFFLSFIPIYTISLLLSKWRTGMENRRKDRAS